MKKRQQTMHVIYKIILTKSHKLSDLLEKWKRPKKELELEHTRTISIIQHQQNSHISLEKLDEKETTSDHKTNHILIKSE